MKIFCTFAIGLLSLMYKYYISLFWVIESAIGFARHYFKCIWQRCLRIIGPFDYHIPD
jgi:hypothetical protein